MSESHKKIKILFAINDLTYSGGQMTVIYEANLLFAKGYDVFVTILLSNIRSPLLKKLLIPPDHINIFSFSSFYDIRSFFELVRYLRRICPDVVISNLFFTNFMIRTAKIFYPHMRVFIREGNMPVEKSRLMKLFDRVACFLFTEKIIVNAEAIAKSFVEELKIPSRKIVTIYNGIDNRFFDFKDKNELRKRFGFTNSDFIILNVASMSSIKKGHHILLQAFGLLSANDSTLRLILVGDGKHRKILENTALNIDSANHIIFAGKQDNIDEWLGIADLFVLPSFWEGTPNALLEAMASGLAVISTPVGGIKEIINNHKNGVFFKVGDVQDLAQSILRIRNDEDIRIKLGIEARKSAAELTWGKHIEALERLITN